ncbi:MAG: TraB/GumN family protein [Methanomicrobiales archaeon]|nr:TraB/GumN family protein [Methanomicrobiales archaeon]
MTPEIRIVGTAHVSQKSVEEVRAAIEEFKPTIVAVELDEPRYQALKEQEMTPEISEVIRTGNFTQMLVQWILAYLQRRIGMDVGVEPGADMKAAIEVAEREHLPIALVDRDIRITLSRFWKGMGLREKLRLLYALALSLVSGGEESIDVDALTQQDVVTAAIEEFRKFSPRGAQALIDERDAYIASRLIQLGASHERVLAVIGAGHVSGVRTYLETPSRIPPLSTLSAAPVSRPWGKIFGVVVLALFLLLILALAFSGLGFETLLQAFLYWIVIHGVLSAGCALLAGGHPLSALTAFSVSWLTALNPLIAAGWFAAIPEAKIRKPTPADFRAIVQAEDFAQMRKIPLFRVVLVAAVTNVGSTVATFAYYLTVLPLLHIDPAVVLVQGFSNLWNWLIGLSGAIL